jgi:hypothetical protein
MRSVFLTACIGHERMHVFPAAVELLKPDAGGLRCLVDSVINENSEAVSSRPQAPWGRVRK